MAADAAVAPTMTGAPADPARPAAGLGLPVEAASAAWAAAAPLAGAAVVPAAVSEAAAAPSMRAVDAAWVAAVDADAKTTLLGKKIGCAKLHSQFFWISFYLVP